MKLIDLLEKGHDTAYGNAEGRQVYQKLADAVDGLPGARVIGISLDGIKRTDASFPRESVVSFVKAKIHEKGFYVFGIINQDLIDNWDAAARIKNQNIIVLIKDSYQVLGPELNLGAKNLLDFIFEKGKVTTSDVADKWEVSAQNASAKLKKLHNQGLIVGRKEAATSGGMEYVYEAIK
ncbi:MAG: DNA-binding protein [Gammaproteobacteria bacterium]|nr:MAG: DNA-binding protein [Gammaproteobacteria bacterium]RLA53758.1 MAG: DNA-binding protein [Gammaproteobacteria bacterium]